MSPRTKSIVSCGVGLMAGGLTYSQLTAAEWGSSLTKAGVVVIVAAGVAILMTIMLSWRKTV